MCVCMWARSWEAEDNLQKPVLSFPHEGIKYGLPGLLQAPLPAELPLRLCILDYKDVYVCSGIVIHAHDLSPTCLHKTMTRREEGVNNIFVMCYIHRNINTENKEREILRLNTTLLNIKNS